MTDIVEGDPHEEILDYVTEHGIDMVIMEPTAGQVSIGRSWEASPNE